MTPEAIARHRTRMLFAFAAITNRAPAMRNGGMVRIAKMIAR